MRLNIGSLRQQLTDHENKKTFINLKALLQYFSGELALKIVGLFLVPLNTRFLTPTEYGKFNFVITALETVSPLLGLGTISHLSVGYHQFHGDARKNYISTIFNFRLLCGAILAFCVLIAMSSPYRHTLGKSLIDTPALTILMPLIIFFYGFNFIGLNIFNARNHAGIYSSSNVAIGILSIMANLALIVYFKLGFLGLCIGLLVSNILGFILSAAAIKDAYRFKIKAWAMRPALAFAIPALPHLFSGTILRFLDRFMMASSGSLVSLGALSLAQTLVSPILLAGTSIANLISPKIYKIAAQNSKSEAFHKLRYYIEKASICLACAGIAIYAFAHIVIHTLPSTYREILHFLTYSISVYYMLCFYWFISIAANMNNFMIVYSFTSVPLLILGIVLNHYLSSYYGTVGVILATALTGFLQPLIFMFILKQRQKIPSLITKPIRLFFLMTLNLLALDFMIETFGYGFGSIAIATSLLGWLREGVRSGIDLLKEE